MLARIFDEVKSHQTISVSCSKISVRHVCYSGASSFEARKNKVLYFLLRIVPLSECLCCVTETGDPKIKLLLLLLLLLSTGDK